MYLKDASLLNFENGFCYFYIHIRVRKLIYFYRITIHTQSLPVKYESFQHNGYWRTPAWNNIDLETDLLDTFLHRKED